MEVSTLHKGLVCHDKVQVLQRVLRQELPQPGVGIIGDKGVGIGNGCPVQNLLDVPEGLGVVIHDQIEVRRVRVLHQIVQIHRLDLELVKVAQIRA